MRLKVIIAIVTLGLSISWPSMAQDASHNLSDEDGIQFFQGTWNEALALAEKENKPIFLDVYAKRNKVEEVS